MAGTYRKAPAGTSSEQEAWSRQRILRRRVLGRCILRRSAALLGLAASAVLVAACGSSGGSTGSSGADGNSGSNGSTASANVVSTRQLSGVGTVLVNSSGRTIYSVKTPSEVNGNIKCTGSCLSFWFPVTAGSVNPGSSGLPGKLGSIHRPDDGKTQLTYDGMPLYTFRLDTAAGQAHGNNYTDSFNGTTFHWQAVTTSGTRGGQGTPAPAPSHSSSGYGY
jgi:predicted lipoprotein with Yx(FWY)xxD motif